jgi:hypothetical protein
LCCVISTRVHSLTHSHPISLFPASLSLPLYLPLPLPLPLPLSPSISLCLSLRLSLSCIMSCYHQSLQTFQVRWTQLPAQRFGCRCVPLTPPHVNVVALLCLNLLFISTIRFPRHLSSNFSVFFFAPFFFSHTAFLFTPWNTRLFSLTHPPTQAAPPLLLVHLPPPRRPHADADHRPAAVHGS